MNLRIGRRREGREEERRSRQAINGERCISSTLQGTQTGHLNVTYSPLTPSSIRLRGCLSSSPFCFLLLSLSLVCSAEIQAVQDRTGLLIMPCAAELANGEAVCAVKVGTTGTIGSLMTRELEAIKAAPPHAAAAVATTAATPRLRRQSSPVSVPCGGSPRKIIALRKSSSSLSSSSSSNGSGRRTDRVSAEEEAAAGACKPTARRSSTTPASSPMLRSDGGALVDGRSSGKAKKKKKKEAAAAARGCRVAGVEVVDVRCGNPMSSRLRRLGFSKLSETFA